MWKIKLKNVVISSSFAKLQK